MKDINLFKTKDSIFLKKIKSKSDLPCDDCDGYLIDASEKEARRIIDSLGKSKKIIAVVGGGSSFNRRAIETLKIDYLISPERGEKKDSLKQRDSGLNQVLAKEAAKRKVSIVIDMSEVSKLSEKEKALRIEKLIQNVKICRKAGCKIMVASLGEKSSKSVDGFARSAFGVSLGMSTSQAKDAVNF